MILIAGPYTTANKSFQQYYNSYKYLKDDCIVIYIQPYSQQQLLFMHFYCTAEAVCSLFDMYSYMGIKGMKTMMRNLSSHRRGMISV